MFLIRGIPLKDHWTESQALGHFASSCLFVHVKFSSDFHLVLSSLNYGYLTSGSKAFVFFYDYFHVTILMFLLIFRFLLLEPDKNSKWSLFFPFGSSFCFWCMGNQSLFWPFPFSLFLFGRMWMESSSKVCKIPWAWMYLQSCSRRLANAHHARLYHMQNDTYLLHGIFSASKRHLQIKGLSDRVDLWVIKIKKPMILCARSMSTSSEQRPCETFFSFL